MATIDFKKVSAGKIQVSYDTMPDRHFAYLLCGDDGIWFFTCAGFGDNSFDLTDHMVGILYKELRELNEPWEKQIDDYFKQSKVS